MTLFNTSMGGSVPKTLVTPDGTTDSIAIEKVDGKTVKPSSTLGNATADKVLQGYSFTSDGGFEIAGTSTAASDLEAAQGEIIELEGQLDDANTTLQDALFLGESKLASLPSVRSWGPAAYGNGKFVVFPYNTTSSVFAYGDDTNGWKQGTLPVSISVVGNGVCFGNNKFVALQNGGINFVYSSNGINWTKGTLPESKNLSHIAYGNNAFIAVGGTTVIYSNDGITWNTLNIKYPLGSLDSTRLFGQYKKEPW